MVHARWKIWGGLATAAAIVLVFQMGTRPAKRSRVFVEDVGKTWAWQIASRGPNDSRLSTVEESGVGIQEGFRKFWDSLLQDDGSPREFELRWNDALLAFSSEDRSLPQLSILRRYRQREPEKYRRAIDFLVEGQMKTLAEREPEEIDLHDETIALLSAIP